MPEETKAANTFAGPTVMYGPKGESKVFNHSADVPKGWKDAPPSAEEIEAAPSKPAPTTTPVADMDRSSIIAALEAGQIKFQKNASSPALYALLTENVKAHLTAEKIAVDPEAKTSELLALLTPPE